MQDLIERLEIATGPDRELDGDLYARLMGWDDGKTPAITLKYAKLEAPAYTGSIDAAMRLVPKGWFGSLPLNRNCDAWLRESNRSPIIYGHGKTSATALCVASLKARAALSSTK